MVKRDFNIAIIDDKESVREMLTSYYNIYEREWFERRGFNITCDAYEKINDFEKDIKGKKINLLAFDHDLKDPFCTGTEYLLRITNKNQKYKNTFKAIMTGIMGRAMMGFLKDYEDYISEEFDEKPDPRALQKEAGKSG
jgi:hypothetical protein